jgi:phosphopantetheine adenylyltransferase
MKRYKQLVKELPSKKVIFAFGRFQPPTNGHALLVQAVTKLARAQGADHVIYASRSNDKKSNPLPVDRKVYYLKRMFPRVNFVAANAEVRTFMEAAAMLSKKYKNLVMIAGSDRVPEYKKLLDKYNGTLFNFDTVEVVSAGERDPDSDTAAGMSGTKMREAAKKGDFASFKKGLPQALTELDGKRLMNELRVGMGMESIKEDIKFETTDIREAYLKGSIFNVGDKVQDTNGQYEIVDRGANYISVVNESGVISKKWLNAVTPVVDIQEDVPSITPPDEITYKGYTTKNFKRSNDASAAFTMSIQRAQDPVAILNAIKATDEYMGINDRHIAGEELTDKERTQWNDAHKTAREYLQKIGEFAHHQDYWHTHEHEFQDLNSDYPQMADMADQFSEGLQEMKFTDADKIKVARVIATAMGVEEVDKQSSPTNLVNMALRKIKNKTFSKASYSIISNMINTVKEAGIKFDEKLIPTQVTEALVGASIEGANDNPTLRRMKIMHHLGEEDDEPGEKEDDMSDDEIQKHIDGMDEEEFWHAYDDDELAIVDSDTGEEVGNIKEETEQLDEVLSRAERIRAKVRFARSQSKRDRRLQIALRTRSSTSKINSRARRMAVKVLKQRLARKPLDTLSVSEKERIERIVQQRKSSLNRIAMRMVPKIRRIENDRLTHKAFTK